jgi:predicted ABC-type ATPase
LIAGINGAGKTSFFYDVLEPRTPGAEFVNADLLERERWPTEIGRHSYEAGRIAAERRAALIAARVSFVTETVFSHPSKLELIDRARAADFVVVLYHIHVSTPELAAARVRTRVSEGGHDVPAETIAARHPRTLALLQQAVRRADRAYVFDNSRLNLGFTHVLTFEGGQVERIGAYVPAWVKETYAGPIRAYLAARAGRN